TGPPTHRTPRLEFKLQIHREAAKAAKVCLFSGRSHLRRGPGKKPEKTSRASRLRGGSEAVTSKRSYAVLEPSATMAMGAMFSGIPAVIRGSVNPQSLTS